MDCKQDQRKQSFIQDWNNVCMDTYSYWFSGIFWWADSCGYCSKEDEVCRIYSLSGEICEILIYGGVNRSQKLQHRIINVKGMFTNIIV